MNTEHLKLILETLQGAGEGAYQIAIAYLIVEALPHLCLLLFMITAIVFGYKIGLRAMHNSTRNSTLARGWREVCLLLGDRQASFLPTDEEARRVVAKVDALTKTNKS
jgi:hypothetical protein